MNNQLYDVLQAGGPEPVYVYIRENIYRGNLPEFYDENDFPELSELKAHWKEIRDEIFRVESMSGQLTGHHTYNTPPISGELNWTNFYLDNFMWRSHGNYDLFPFTSNLIRQIPNLTLASVSILSGQSTVNPHYGDTNGIVRCHLGLKIPAAYPECGIRVGNQERGWKEGEFVVFTEAHLHEVWNKTDERRYLLIIDIIPDFFKISKIRLSSKVLGAQTYIFMENKLKFLKKSPPVVAKSLYHLFSFLWRLYLPLQRKFRLK